MNKLKYGVTALCGTLAAVSAANAGEMTVKGGATATYSSNQQDVTGNPIGMNSGLTFTGTGELDNGTSFTLTITHADQDAYSASQIALTTPSMGTFTIDQSGGGLDRIDDMMPTAWEETTGTSLGTGINNVNGVAASASVEWAAPTDMLMSGLTTHIAYTPRATQNAKANDKGVGGAGDSVSGAGYDVVFQYGAIDGLNLFGGWSSIDQSSVGYDGDRNQKSLGATYAMGGFTLGYQWSEDNKHTLAEASTNHYENTLYGISFSVNDDLSLSYGYQESKRTLVNNSSVQAEVSSFQLSYSMGGASLKVAETQGDNLNYGTGNDKDATTVALTLAF
jgi:outer membrane protein OmpU